MFALCAEVSFDRFGHECRFIGVKPETERQLVNVLFLALRHQVPQEWRGNSQKSMDWGSCETSCHVAYHTPGLKSSQTKESSISQFDI